MSLLSTLTRLIAPHRKANPAGEGNWHQGPYHIIGPNGGALPYTTVPWNFWQCDIDPSCDPGCSVVEACVWAYIRAIAQLPGYHKRELDNGGIETVTTSALSRLLRYPNSYQTSSDFLTHVVRSLLYTGNSYSLAVRNQRNEVVELHWLPPTQSFVTEVMIEGQEMREVFYSIGENPLLNYREITSFRGFFIPARDVLHIKLATPRHPLIGQTWLSSLAIDLDNRTMTSGSINRFLKNASRPSGVLKTQMQLTAAQVTDLRARWNEQASGMNQGGVPILTHGLEWQPLGISSKDNEIVATQQLTDKTIVGVFGVPGVLVGVQDGAPFASTEALMNWWLANGLGDVLNRIETAIDALVGMPANEWTEYDTDALLRTNTAERIDALVKGVQGGIYAPNEARAKEGYRAVEAGDEPRVQQQVVPLSFAATPPPAPQSPAAPPPSAEPVDAGGDGQDATVAEILARMKASRHEHKRAA